MDNPFWPDIRSGWIFVLAVLAVWPDIYSVRISGLAGISPDIRPPLNKMVLQNSTGTVGVLGEDAQKSFTERINLELRHLNTSQ